MTRFQQWLVVSALHFGAARRRSGPCPGGGRRRRIRRPRRTDQCHRRGANLAAGTGKWRAPPLSKRCLRRCCWRSATGGNTSFNALPDFQTLAPDAGGRILVDIDLLKAAGLKPVLKCWRR